MEKLLVHRKVKKADTGVDFDTFFCYRQVERKGEDGSVTWVDDINPATGKSIPVKVKLADSFKKQHPIADIKFPVYMVVDMQARTQVTTAEGKIEEVNTCYITVDKDKYGKARLDKYGKRHPLCVIHAVVEMSEAPRREISWDDVADFE